MDRRINLLAQLITEDPNTNKSHLYKRAILAERRLLREAPTQATAPAAAAATPAPATPAPAAQAPITAPAAQAPTAAPAAQAPTAAQAAPTAAAAKSITGVAARKQLPNDVKVAQPLLITLQKAIPALKKIDFKDANTAAQWYAANGGGQGIVNLLKQPANAQALAKVLLVGQIK